MRISAALLIGTSFAALASPAFAQTQQEDAAQAGQSAGRTAVAGHCAGDRGRRDHRHRDQARQPRPGRALLDQRPDRGRHPARQCPDARGHQPQRRRPYRPEPRAGPEPGFGARRLRRSDRARPAGREGTGRRLSRRDRHLAVAVHARLRPVRSEPRRDAARSAGHAVRFRLASAAPSATSPISRDVDRIEGAVEARHQLRRGRRYRLVDLKGAVNLPLAPTAAVRVVGYGTHFGGFIDSRRPVRQRRTSTTATAIGGRVVVLFQPTPELKITPRIALSEGRSRRLQPRGRLHHLRQPVHDHGGNTLGKREQYLLFREKFRDKTFLADLVASYDFGPVELTSASTSYLDRDILVSRDASALTGSVSCRL